MAGDNETKEKLNNTLSLVASLLNEAELDNWFVAYGTLLGIIRDNSCINNDDDVDIIIDKTHANQLRDILNENNFTLLIDHELIYKTKATEEYASVDFYLASVTPTSGVVYNDTWDRTPWTNCAPLARLSWKNTTLLIPNLAEQKLQRLYGPGWLVPASTKPQLGSPI
ncbi:MAG: LicD family protein [Betaproteobacteria bacterium]